MTRVPLRALDELRSLVGESNVIIDPDRTSSYAIDWTGRFRGATPAVVRPADTAEVAAVLATCHRHGIAVVPQGGNTGLVGGSVPLHGEILLSLRRLDQLDEIDCSAMQVTAGAGVTLADLQRGVAPHGLMFGVDIGARDSATLGGMVATNAGGLHFVRYGGVREQVVGLEAVLADGTVVAHLDGLDKDNTGYDWPGLLCGSEGTLAVVTRARLRLVDRPTQRAVAVLAFESASLAVDASVAVRRHLGTSLSAAEVFFHDGMRLVVDRFGLTPPFARDHPVYLLVEAIGDDQEPGPLERLAAAVDGLDGLLDAAVADEARCDDLWALRERHTEAIARAGEVRKFDVTVPIARLAAFIDRVVESVEGVSPGAQVFVFGHVADGNLHINVVGNECGDLPAGAVVDDTVLSLVAAFRGSISAEHGVGTAKRAWLHLARQPAELDLFSRIKAAFDPTGVLNPNSLLPNREPDRTEVDRHR